MIKEAIEEPVTTTTLPVDTVICGDALETLKGFDDNVFDAIVCDPPAGIGFMLSKDRTWDSDKGGRDQWIAWLTSIMKEAMRALKPGGHCLVWALPRTSHWTATALEDAGFEIRDVIHHIYSADTALQSFLASLTPEQHEAFERLIESQASSTLYHLFGSGFPKSLDVSKAIDAHYKATRETIGTKRSGIGRHGRTDNEVFHGSAPEYLKHISVTAPATDAAKTWSGFGSALKPAAEHWILVRKPLSEHSIAENVLRWGTGALNIDGSRIGTAADMNPRDFDDTRRTSPKFSGVLNGGKEGQYRASPGAVPNGRWPSHCLLSHSLLCTDDQCTDGCPVLALDQQSGIRSMGHFPRSGAAGSIWGNGKHRPLTEMGNNGHGDSGTASRYFTQLHPDTPPFYYASKASRKEREAGCEALPTRQGFDKNTSKVIAHVNHDTGETTHAEYSPSSNHNHHPTVKSLVLMNFLVRLCNPPGGIVLDMFCGSGSTLVAAVQQRMHFVGVDQSPEYVEIARARIANAQQQAPNPS
jgi:DNA modification methylase